jgi:hypothetical protein
VYAPVLRLEKPTTFTVTFALSTFQNNFALIHTFQSFFVVLSEDGTNVFINDITNLKIDLGIIIIDESCKYYFSEKSNRKFVHKIQVVVKKRDHLFL